MISPLKVPKRRLNSNLLFEFEFTEPISFEAKVHIFLEGLKILRNLHLTFDYM